MSEQQVTIVGGGLAGLAAGLTVRRHNARVRVCERREEIGARFHGDFQGLENWTTDGDVLEELEAQGVDLTFDRTPFRECVFFDPDGREAACRASQPLWYLVRRGTEPGTLDQSLKAQALAAGVEFEFGQNVSHLPEGGIVTHGPRRVDAIAVGYVFRTDRADAAFGAISDDLAPGGYAYLLICNGRGTLATCMFDDFHRDMHYLAQTRDFFERRVGIRLEAEHPFGGFGNMATDPTVRQGRMLFAGEAAGFQDALFGFGMRFALTSGHLAGNAWTAQDFEGYEAACRRRFRPAIQAAIVNRYLLYERGGARAYRALVRHVSGARDPRGWLRRHYGAQWWTPLVYRLANRRRTPMQAIRHECRDQCDCTYCRCLRDAAAAAAAPAPTVVNPGEQPLALSRRDP